MKSTPLKGALPFYGDYSPGFFNVHSFIFVSVAKYDVRDPNRAHLVGFYTLMINFVDMDIYLRVR